MTRQKESNINCYFKCKALILILGLLALATVAQGGLEMQFVLNADQAGNSPGLDDLEAEAALGDVCNDGNDCTDDSITPTNECVYRFNSNPCDDNSECTTNDHCFNGSCRGTTLDCNDFNECTDDSCTPSNGCIQVNNSNFCDDGLFCNGRDTCSSGSCRIHSGDPCPPTYPCDEIARSCDPGSLTSLISFKAVKKNNVALTPGTCDLAVVPPRCSSGNVGKKCASDAECHVGTNTLIPNKCAGGANINNACSTNADCPGSTCISVLANDIFEVEIFLSRWAAELPAGVRVFLVKLDRYSLVGSENGIALPVGWCAPVNAINCTDSSTCPPAYPICAPPWGCTCTGHDPDLGAFINTSRRDFLLKDAAGNLLDGIFIADTFSLYFKYTGIATAFVGVPDPGLPLYLGTLMLKVSANACGTFTVGFVAESEATFIADPTSNPPHEAYPAMQPLVLTVSDCSRQLLSCSPNHCNVDGRMAHDRLAIGTKLNTDTIVMTFSKPTAGMSAADFEVTLIPTQAGDIVPGVRPTGGITPNGNKATILLDRRIPQTRWTVIRDKGSNKRCYIGSLPAEADGNSITNRDDTLEMFDNLLGVVSPALAIEECDTDRSLKCTPADLVTAVDLLVGADAFTEVNGDMLLTPCPPMRPDP